MSDAVSTADKLRAILEREPTVMLGYLFGSVARADATALSDLDVGVLLAAGAPPGPILNRLLEALETAFGAERIDLVNLRPAPPALAYRVVRDGRLLCCRDTGLRERFESDAVRRYLDFKPLRDAAFAVARRRLLGAP